MSERRRFLMLLGLVGLMVVPLRAHQSATRADGLAPLRTLWQSPPDDARPMMRWWWFGPAVTADDLTAELTRMKAAGIGGVEVQPVYPLTPDTPGAGPVNHPFLSKAFLDALAHTASTARSLGLRFDLTLGSGWPYGGPHIPITRAAGRLRWERVPVRARRVALPDIGAGESLIGAFLPGARQELTDIRDGVVFLPEGERPAEVWVFIASRTGMMVKRAAVGAEGYVLDHYDRAALQAHLDAVGTPMLDAIGDVRPAALFCDSLEVFASDWSSDLLPEFARRRGYDLRAHLGAIVAGGETAEARAVRHDWALTLSELYADRFLQPLAEWSRGRGSRLRIQGYGIPPATLASNRAADLVDGEGWQWRTITASRWAASASRAFDRPVTASETWTWLHSPSFRATPLDLKAEADRHFLQGITQIIGHGWPSTPSGIGGPGWRFYAAGAFNDRNPWFLAMPDVSRYLQRLSALLRQGRPVVDVALYLPTSDALADVTPGRGHLLDLLRERVGTEVPDAILSAGSSFDLVDDGVLADARVEGDRLAIGAQRFRALVLPRVETMPLRTLRLIDTFAKAGGVVLATDRMPASPPGLRVADADRLEAGAITARLFGSTLGSARAIAATQVTASLVSAIGADVRVAPHADAIGHVHRQTEDADVYFVANTANVPYAGALTVRARGLAEWWDPVTGATAGASVSTVDDGGMTLPLDLPAYGSTVLVVARGGGVRVMAVPVGSKRAPTAVSPTEWTLTPPGGVARTIAAPRSWDTDEDARFASGVGIYEARVTLPGLRRGTRVSIDFGPGTPLEEVAGKGPGMRAWIDAPVRDAAVVFVNGARAGVVWTAPWTLDVTAHVRAGTNDLRIEVGNTQMNAMAGRPLPDYRLLTLRYGERFQPQDMDQVRPLPSGLVGQVRVLVTRP